MKTIEVIISPSGESRLETKGFAGSECKAASRALESALGKSMAESLTAEFHAAGQEEQNRLGNEA